jgi:hypothetical protein
MQQVPSSAGRVLAMTLLLGHFLAIAMAWSPSLHDWLHGDNDEAQHHCAATAMIDGQIDRPAVPGALTLLAPVPAGREAIRDLNSELPSAFRASPLERGPPRA